MYSPNTTGGMCWRACSGNLSKVRRRWRLLVALAAGLLSLLYAGAAYKGIVSKNLYPEGKENDLLQTGDGNLNISNPHSNSTGRNADVHLLDLRKLVDTYDPVYGISEKQHSLREEYDLLLASNSKRVSNNVASRNKIDQRQLELRKQGKVFNPHGTVLQDNVGQKPGKFYDQLNDLSQGDVDRTFTSKWEVNLKENYENTTIKRSKDLQNTFREDYLILNSSTTTTTSHHLLRTTPTQETVNPDMASYKKILFYTTFFSDSWDTMLRNKTDIQNCPVSACTFLQHSNPEDAHAIIFHFADFSLKSVPAKRHPEQIYVWFNMEPPEWDEVEGLHGLRPKFKFIDKLLQPWEEKEYGRPGFFNWTMTYHRASDVMLPYGALWPLTGEGDHLRPALLNKSGPAYRDYVKALKGGVQLQGEREAGKDWETFFRRPKLVAWMVSHCNTTSGREIYVEELQRHIEVDVFGDCGELLCNKDDMAECYTFVLQPTYKFYLAFENSMCADYITEKVWLPLIYGLVPVVYGGVKYSDFLPPHSYVDATRLTPLQLARRLSSIGSSSVRYGRYHLWRRYWKVVRPLPMCEICYLLHGQAFSSSIEAEMQRQSYHSLRKWWSKVGNCTTRYPRHLYPLPRETAV